MTKSTYMLFWHVSQPADAGESLDDGPQWRIVLAYDRELHPLWDPGNVRNVV